MEETNVIKMFPKKLEKVENTQPIIEEENDSPSKLLISSKIFGISPRQLEDEFIDFKIDKLLKDLDYLAVDERSELSLKEKVMATQKLGLGSITVMPSRVSSVKKYSNGKPIEINTVISYPTGDDFSSVKIANAKEVSKCGVKCVSTPISPIMLGYYRYTQTEKELKKMRKILKNCQLKLICNINDFSQSMLSILVKLVLLIKADGIIIKVRDYQLTKIKMLMDMCSGKINLEVQGDLSLKLTCELLRLGVGKISASNIEELSNELSSILKL